LSYLTEVLADNPTHYWRLADRSGEWAADIGSARPEMMIYKPQASGSVLGLSYSGPNSDGGSALVLSPSYVQCAAIQATFPFTIEICSFFNYVTAALTALMAWNYDNQTVGLAIGGALPGVYVAYSSTGNAAGHVPSKYVWDHVAGVYTAAATSLYVNGALQQTVGATALTGPQSVFLGRTQANGQPLPGGSLSEVAIYPTALSAARLLAHFNALNQRTQTPVFGGAGDFSGAPTNAAYTDLLLKILQSVRKPFVDL